MLAHTLKHVLELAPEALPLIKQASVGEEYPLDSKDSCIASALCVNYHINVDGKPVNPYTVEKVANAVKLYKVGDIVSDLTSKFDKVKFEKMANYVEVEDFKLKQSYFATEKSGLNSTLDRVTQAEELYKEAQELGVEPNEEVLKMTGHCYLNKLASVKALSNRYHRTQNVGYVKLATVLGKVDEFKLKQETLSDLCKTIATMDKEAGLDLEGYDFYKEALVMKQADAMDGMTIKLRGVDVPLDKILALGKDRLAEHVGTEITREMDLGPMNFKAALEALPIDSQHILLKMSECV